MANNNYFKFDEKKEEMKWSDYIAKKLLNTLIIEDNNINYYTNILTGAEIIGLDANFWAHTQNSIIEPKEVDKLKKIFEENEYYNESVVISGKSYKITNCEDNDFMELKDGDCFASIAKTEKGLIIGLYNIKSKLKKNGEELYQNREISNFVVKNLKENLKVLGY